VIILLKQRFILQILNLFILNKFCLFTIRELECWNNSGESDNF
jgi:hypothetical protein